MNLRWSILHFFIYIVQICWNLDTHCASFVYGMHRLSYQPALSIHFPFSIFHPQFSILHNEKSLSFPRGIFLYLLGVS